MSRTTVVPALVVALVPLALSAPAQAQGFDRSKPPVLGPPPALRVPAIHDATLPNGLTLRVVEMHEVPLVQVDVLIEGGGREDGDLAGLATFTAGMLDEGAGTRNALGIAAETEFLGASLATGADWNFTTVSLRVPKRTMGPALNLLADVVLRPTFPRAEVIRQRDLRLAAILQQRDQPNAVASLVLNRELFPDGNPYHRSLTGDSSSTAVLDSATVRAFYERAILPNRTTVIVTGDITLDEARRELAARFEAWARGPALGRRDAAAPPAIDRPTTFFVVDKPGAAQSVVVLAERGVAHDNPDYFALQVMNTILGGSFSSRLNTNLRETKGYTYGAGSSFQYRPIPGPFTASAQVRTNVTDSALVEFMTEINRIRDTAVSGAELDRAKAYLALGLAGDFETTGQVARQIAQLVTFHRPPSYFETFATRVQAVTAADVQRVAGTYLHPDRLTVVVVGDLRAIRPGIEALGWGPVREVTP